VLGEVHGARLVQERKDALTFGGRQGTRRAPGKWLRIEIGHVGPPSDGRSMLRS
jgi:hypothetical protein